MTDETTGSTVPPAAMKMLAQAVTEVQDAKAELKSLGPYVHGEVNRLDKYGRTNRLLIAVTCLLLLVVVGLAVVVGNNHSDARIAKEKAQAVAAYSTSSCDAGNKFRQDNREIWNYLLALSAGLQQQTGKKQTAAEKAALVKFAAKVNATFADRDCAALLAASNR